jgi:hypothetical protein
VLAHEFATNVDQFCQSGGREDGNVALNGGHVKSAGRPLSEVISSCRCDIADKACRRHKSPSMSLETPL